MADTSTWPTLREAYSPFFKALAQASVAAAKIDETNIYQKANPATRKIMDQLVSDNLLPESHLGGMENFIKFADLVKSGKSGLILMEHYSNTDLPVLIYLLEHSGNEKLEELSRNIVAIAGMKLNEDDPIVRALAESFTRVVIYPTRSQQKIKESGATEEEAIAEEAKAKKINFAAMRAMDKCKRNGEAILVFPSGTRYRPGHPETKRGLREIDGYIRLFEYVMLVSINGNILRLQDEDMLNDRVVKDKMVLTASEILECKPLRKEFMASLPEDYEEKGGDSKQAFIDSIMARLDKLHEEAEKTF